MRPAALLAGLAWLLCASAAAQQHRPGDERPWAAAPGATGEVSLALPPVQPVTAGPDPGRPVHVRGFRIAGNQVLDDEEIARALAAYTGRALHAEELIAARDAVTRLYLDHGYVASGAWLPDQRVDDGIVELRVTEGGIERIVVEGTRGVRPAYVRRQLARATRGPVQVHALRDALRLLQADPLLERVDAELAPGSTRGASVLHLSVRESPPWDAELVADGAESPAVGAANARLRLVRRNLLGLGDALTLETGISDGLRSRAVEWALPLGGAGTRLLAGYRWSDAEVVESPFDELDIESRASTARLRLEHPLLREPSRELVVGVSAELRRSSTRLLDRSFSFSPGADDGRTRASVLRLTQDWVSRGPERVWALRSTFSLGVDALGATDTGRGRPDASFFSWLGQAQWVRRLERPRRGSLLVVRGDVQLTPGPLFSMEQFAVGGMRTVRGYRESLLVRDSAAVLSAELRLPLLRTPAGDPVLQIAPFVDLAHAWNHDPAGGPRTLSSAGLGLLYRPDPRLELALYWGARLRRVPRSGDDWLQNHGLHLRIAVRPF